MSGLVAITQPYVPAYRVPLFDELSAQLAQKHLQLLVVSSAPAGRQSLRGDASTGEWNVVVPSRQVPVGRWQLSLRQLPIRAVNADILISELEALNFVAWRDTVRKRPTVLWGHGKGFVNQAGKLSDRVESVLASRVEHVMTYSESGRRHVLAHSRLGESCVTAIGNSTDSASLRGFMNEVGGAGRLAGSEFAAMYVGGLDASKRIDFLLNAYSHAVQIEPRFKLTIVGRGDDEGLAVDAARRFSGVSYVPEARGADLAALAAGVSALWVPGRVGLVAVDALAMGLPVHTTNFENHAPEIEFLSEGEGEVEFIGPSPAEFAAQSLHLLKTKKAEVRPLDKMPTVSSVAGRMVSVIMTTLGEASS